MKKAKVVIKETIHGTKYTVYKKYFGFWRHSYGYKPLDSCFFLFDKDIDRLKRIYGDGLAIEDCGTRGGIKVTS